MLLQPISEEWKRHVPLVQKVEMSKVELDDLTGVVKFNARVVLGATLLKYTTLLEKESHASTTAPLGVDAGNNTLTP